MRKRKHVAVLTTTVAAAVAAAATTTTTDVCDAMSDTGLVELQQPVQRTVRVMRRVVVVYTSLLRAFINHTGRRDERIGLIEFAAVRVLVLTVFSQQR